MLFFTLGEWDSENKVNAVVAVSKLSRERVTQIGDSQQYPGDDICTLNVEHMSPSSRA